MAILTLKRLEQRFAIHRFSAETLVPKNVFEHSFYFIAKTDDELSIVVPHSCDLNSDKVERDWSALKIQGPLDFALTGIIAKIATLLANEKISVFAISSFDTDYILIKHAAFEEAISVLSKNDYQIV